MRRDTVPARQDGSSLIEALIALVVLSLGLVATARLQSVMRWNTDAARHRTEAVHIAKEDLESLRSFASIESSPTGRSYTQIASASLTVSPDAGGGANTMYTLERAVGGDGGLRSARVDVAWTDRSGTAQHVALQSAIAGTPPAFSGALAVRAPPQPFMRVRGRSGFIPFGARDWGDGTSVFKPSAAATLAMVFDNLTGAVVQVCTSISPGTTTRGITAADLQHCAAQAGMLLSGVVRFATAASADPTQAKDAPLAMDIVLRLDPVPAAAPICVSEPQKVVLMSTDTGSHREAVPIDAAPSAYGVAAWTDLGDRFVAYHCVVSAAGAAWSGRSSVVPRGWIIGTGAGEYRVCRFSSDQDASGSIDTNAEHPNFYSHVSGPLMQQNFLVIRGDQACPVEAGARPSSNAATVQHQP